MKINWKTTTILVSAMLALELVCEELNRRTIARLNQRVVDEREVAHLLAMKLDSHEIGLDPFEQIAINTLIGQK